MDAYTLCPGGCGKKIKFCCGTEIIADLEKLDRMLEGEQRRACVEHIAKMPAKFRDKPCILTKLIRAELEAGNTDAYIAACQKLLEVDPESVVALACLSSYRIYRGEVREGVAMLQRALPRIEMASEGIAGLLVLGGMLNAANDLLASGHIWAARAHYRLIDQRVQQDNNPGEEMLRSLDAEKSLPLVWKDDPFVPPCDVDAPYRQEYESAMQIASECQWLSALERFEAILQHHPDDPDVWRAVAAQRACLADDAGAAEAFSKAAALDVPLDDAVACELYAITLAAKGKDDPENAKLCDDVIRVTLPLDDLDTFSARVATDRRFLRIVSDLSRLAADDRPPPREAYRVFDRPRLQPEDVDGQAGASLRREDLPLILGELLLFGRETDRPPRIEAGVQRSDLDAVRAILAEVAAGGVGEPSNEQIVRQMGPDELALTRKWQLPPGAPWEVEGRLQLEEFRYRLLEVWPQGKLRQGGGLTYAEAARSGDPRLARLVLAAILDIESNNRHPDFAPLFNELRTRLGLPAAVDIDPFHVDLDSVSIIELHRLPAELLPDDQLTAAFNLAASVRAPVALVRLGEAALERSSFEVDRKMAVCINLARAGFDPWWAVKYLRQGRELAAAAGKSPAVWLLEELALRLAHPEKPAELHDVINRAADCANEPGVALQLTQLLARYGIIDPATFYEQASRDSALSVAGLELRRQAGLPAAETVSAATAAEEKKPGLWLPGMD